MLKWCFELRSLERVFSDRRERSCLVGVAPPSTDAPEAEGFPWFPPTRISMQCRLPGNCLRTATQRLTTRSVYDSGLYEGEGLCFNTLTVCWELSALPEVRVEPETHPQHLPSILCSQSRDTPLQLTNTPELSFHT